MRYLEIPFSGQIASSAPVSSCCRISLNKLYSAILISRHSGDYFCCSVCVIMDTEHKDVNFELLLINHICSL